MSPVTRASVWMSGGVGSGTPPSKLMRVLLNTGRWKYGRVAPNTNRLVLVYRPEPPVAWVRVDAPGDGSMLLASSGLLRIHTPGAK